MVYLAGILGNSKDGTTFERPSNYTPNLSALVHCARLCLLEATLPRFAYPSLGWSARPKTGQLKLLNDVREAYLCHGVAAPVGELLSLRAYGRTVSRTDGPSFRVDWTDDGDVLQWDDGAISMADFRQMGHRVLEMINDLMIDLMSGFHGELDLGKLRDRISDHSQRYSFVQDRSNGLRSAYLELSQKVCADPTHGLLTHKGWNTSAVRRYLKKEESLLELIVTGQARDMPMVLLFEQWQVCRELASPEKSALDLIRSSSSYVLVIEPVRRLAVVEYISSCLHLHLRPDLRP